MNNSRRNQHPWELWVLFGIGIFIMAVVVGLVGLYIAGCPKLWWAWLFSGGGGKALLNTIAAVLGGMFAIVFSITFIAVQFVTKHTHRTMEIILDWRLFFYMAGFACAVGLSLWLSLNPTKGGAQLSLFVASIVVASLLLLFWYLRKRMNIEGVIEILQRKTAVRALPVDLKRVQNNIETLDIISTGAFKSGDTGAFEKAVEGRVDILSEIVRYTMALRFLTDLQKELFESIRDTTLATIDDPRAPRIIIDKFKKVGISAIKKWVKEWLKSSKKPEDATPEDMPQIALYAINIIMIVRDACEVEVQDRILFACAIALAEMAELVNDFEQIMKFFESKIKGVCKYFKNFEEWYPRVINHIEKHIHKINTQHLRILPPLKPAHRSKKRSG